MYMKMNSFSPKLQISFNSNYTNGPLRSHRKNPW